jgi:hypothetical protein
MNPFSDVVATGFFIGISFMAAAVIALTVLYFTGPKLGNKNDENKNTPSDKSEPLPVVKKTDTLAKRSRFKIPNLLPKRNSKPEPPSGPLTDKILADDKAKISEKIPLSKAEAADQKETGKAGSSLTDKKTEITPAPVQSEPIAARPAADKLAQPETASSKIINPVSGTPPASPVPMAPVPKVSVPATSPPGIKDSPGAAVNPPPVNSAPEKANLEATKNVEVKEMKIETQTTPEKSTNQTEGGKPVQAAAESKPQNTSSETSFSDLFTQDEEEDEVGRLAKELADIDSDDILEESLSLINQLKRK